MEELVYKEIGKRIKNARINKGLTQQALAESLGLKRTSVTNMEKGVQKFSVHVLYLLSEALEVSPTEFLPKIEELKEKRNIKLHNNNLLINESINSEELNWIEKLISDEKEDKQ